MSLSAWLYLVSVAYNIEVILTIIFSIFLVVMFLMCVVKLVTADDPDFGPSIAATKVLNNVWRRWYVVIAFLLLFCLTPDQKTMYLMLGTNYLSTSDIPAKVSQALNYKLDGILVDLKRKEGTSDTEEKTSTSPSIAPIVSPSVLAHQYLKFARNDDD